MADHEVDLSAPDRDALKVLVNEYAESDGPVKSSQLADVLDRSEGSIKNQMRGLASLGLVESITGPKGGYEPTDLAFHILGRDPEKETEEVILAGNYDRVDVTIESITLSNVHHPTECRARVQLQQLLDDVGVGDPIVLGPTPEFDLVILGEVTDVLGSGEALLIDVVRMEAPFEGSSR
ncbi:TrmB family transcriptional regulator [Halorhabdus sp. CBA1104]|uniref:Rrf2 family transcriptional regulator n=1 Tax=unclassified Halorhabdus TaxID=2621901 RepID=UPI0012B323E7|nr:MULTISPECIES: Rrf2 family transcriptional regulator [unclassified Halorhabdus]QGN08079.1 TrmB family transcriptional regulator [Halorhabdus sp. CBA1104]